MQPDETKQDVSSTKKVVERYDWPDMWDWLTQMFYWVVVVTLLSIGFFTLYDRSLPDKPARPTLFETRSR